MIEMAVRMRKATERGHFDHGWLDTWHSFSFGEYYHPDHVHFRALRVLNEDRIGPAAGFGMHPHRDMEIVTYVMAGTLEHRDSMGNREVLNAGDLQLMSAGSGILHSEVNPSAADWVRLMQIWILPEAKGLKPSHAALSLPKERPRGVFVTVVSPRSGEGTLAIRQDASIAVALLNPGQTVCRVIPPGRHAWCQILAGSVAMDGADLAQGDAFSVSVPREVCMTAVGPAELMWFDLA